MRLLKTLALSTLGLGMALSASAQSLGGPMTNRVDAGVRDCRASTTLNMPIIAWGADGVTIAANGGALDQNGGAFADAGLDITLNVADDFTAQVEDYLTCESPFLRGTLGMLMAAAPLTQNDPRTEQVVIYKHSWSAGDGLVGNDSVRNVQDLAGKRVALQIDGPHVDFLGRVLQDSGLSISDVTLVWTQGLTGDGDTPAAALLDGRADAALVILPDARILTSGNVGTGAEGSVRGATTVFSTQEATAVIGDYIAVRRDWFDANRAQAEAIVRALFQTEEQVRRYMNDPASPERTELATTMADVLLGGLPTEEGVFLWQDAISDGWSGNARHFADDAEPRRFSVLMDEVMTSLNGAGVLERPYSLAVAGWDYAALANGLVDVSERQIAAFDPAAAAAAVDRLRRTGQLDENTQIEFLVYFDPAETTFPLALYEEDFEEIIRLAATYSGAIVTIEGHSDPLEYLRAEQNGADDATLRLMRESGRNLSIARSMALMEAINDFAQSQNIRVNAGQFTVDGVGITDPIHNPPTSEAQWRENMRVGVRILRVQVEATTFSPL